jgi:poly-beta-1,6-N-acetyl-D-glucosamine synthase
MILPILIFILIICTFFLYFQLIGYPLLMSRFLTRSEKRMQKDYSYQPFITILVPTYNEGKVIKKRIENLLSQNYPTEKFEIIVVDSGSTDDTEKTAREFALNYPNVKFIQEGARRGKASAINLGIINSKGEINLVTDANDIFNDDALREIGPHFKDPQVGAVGGRVIISNRDNTLGSASSFYWDIESLIRRGETNLDSACTFSGEINAWRKSIIDADKKALTEDLDMAIRIRRQGYKIFYEPEAIAYEAGPTTEKEQITQKKRTMTGTIQCFFKHRKYLWLPRDKYSAVIFPFHKTLQIFSPLLLILASGILLYLLISQQLLISLVYILAAFVLFMSSLVVLRVKLANIRSENINSDRIKSSLPINILKFILLHEYIILLAWKDFISGKYSVTWKKAETTRI